MVFLRVRSEASMFTASLKIFLAVLSLIKMVG
jgi:hypothetical protein